MRETIGRVVFDWVARLDARHVVDSLRGDLGVDIQLVGPCPGGQVGVA